MTGYYNNPLQVYNNTTSLMNTLKHKNKLPDQKKQETKDSEGLSCLYLVGFFFWLLKVMYLVMVLTISR